MADKVVAVTESSWFLLRYMFLLTVAVAVAFIVLYCTVPKKYVGIEATARTTAQSRWVRGTPLAAPAGQEIFGLKLVYSDQVHNGYATGYMPGSGYLTQLSPDDQTSPTKPPSFVGTPLTDPASITGFVNSLDMAGEVGENFVLYGDLSSLVFAQANGNDQLATVVTMPMLPKIATPFQRYHAVIVTTDPAPAGTDQVYYVIYSLDYCYAPEFGPDDVAMVAYKIVPATNTLTTLQSWRVIDMPFAEAGHPIQVINGIRGTKNGFVLLGNPMQCQACDSLPAMLVYFPLNTTTEQFEAQTASMTVIPELPPSDPSGSYGLALSFGLAASRDGLTVAVQNNYVVPELWIFSLANGTMTKTQVIPSTTLQCQFGNSLALSSDGNNLAVYGQDTSSQGSWLVQVFPRINSTGEYSIDPTQFSTIQGLTNCTLASDGYYYPQIVATTDATTNKQRVLFATRDLSQGPQYFRIQNYSAPWTPLP